MEILGVLGAVLLVCVVVASVKVRNDEKKKLFKTIVTDEPIGYVVEPPLVKAQLDVISARARKRRSDYGTKRPRKPSEGATTDSGNLNYPPG